MATGGCVSNPLPELREGAQRRDTLGSDTAVFVLRTANDTAAVDRVMWDGNHLTGAAVAGRTLQVDYRLSVEATGEVSSYAFRLGPPPVTVGDSVAFATPPAGTPPTVVSRGRVPLWNATPGTYDVLFRRARIAGDAQGLPAGAVITVRLPLFRFGAASVNDSAFVTLVGTDSAKLLVKAEGTPPTEMFAKLDRMGRLLYGIVPAEGWLIERVRNLPTSAFPLASAYGAPNGAPYVAEDVRLVVSANTILAATLTLPVGVRGPVPAVVLLHGSSPSDRNNSRLPLPGLFWQLADTLTRRGIAVLRYDQRGVGTSTGSSDSATIHVRADDARAALAYLATRPGIDSTRLGLVGLSEGAMVAPLVAARRDSTHKSVAVRAVVLLSSPARTGRELSAYQTRVSAERFAGHSGKRLDSALAVGRAEDEALAKNGHGHEAALLAYDPMPAARWLCIPALILHGATDLQVPAEDAARLGDAIRETGNGDVTVHVFPNVNHVLLADPGGDWRHYVALPSLIAPAPVRGLIADWLVKKLGPAAFQPLVQDCPRNR